MFGFKLTLMVTIVVVFLLYSSIVCQAMNSETVPAHNWNHLVGKRGEEAAATIQREHPDLKVYVVKHNSMVTMDFRTDRVRIYIDDHGNVLRSPQLG